MKNGLGSMKNRRDFLKLMSGCAASLPAWLGSGRGMGWGAAQAAEQGRPNVLMFVLDDMNDWLGCLGGHRDVKTPNIDRLAQRGVTFTNAQCAAPICNPSRASFFTGVRPATSGVYDNPQPFRPILPDVVTMPQHFMAHGYRVVGGGKLFHSGFPDPQSWQEYFPSRDQYFLLDPLPPSVPANGIPDFGQMDWGPVDASDEEMSDGKVARWAAEVLRRSHDRPFFLGVGLVKPHIPLYVPQKYFDMYRPESVALPSVWADDLADVPQVALDWVQPGVHDKIVQYQQWRKAVAGYLACVSFVDAQVGWVLDALDESPYAANTIIVLWGDNGWHLGEKLHWEKSVLWEESCHVPLIIAAPGLTSPGGRCSKPVSLMDVYPTLNEICALTPKPELDCQSIRQLLQDPLSSAWNGPPALSTFRQGNHSLRDERFRYTRYFDGSEELFDHKTDPQEWHNLAGDTAYAATKQNFAKYLPKFDAPTAPG